MYFVSFVKENWQIISNDPTPFIGLSCIMFLVGYGIKATLSKSKVDTLNERLSLANEKASYLSTKTSDLEKLVVELSELKEKFEGQPKINIVEEMPPNPNEDEIYFVVKKKKK